jgi:hypothetical protein
LVTLTSSAHTSTSKRIPVLASTVSMNRRSDEVTSAYGSPAASTEASSSRAPGRSGTPSRSTRSQMPAISHSATTSGGAGRAAWASR